MKDYSPHLPLPYAMVYNHRADRPERLRCFLKNAVFTQAAAKLLVTGDRPSLTLWCELKHAASAAAPSYVGTDRLFERLGQLTAESAAIVFCGNTRGLELPRPVTEASSG